MNIFKSSRLVSRSLIGAVGLSAIALLGSPEAVKAADIVCLPGVDWVNNCDSGIDMFASTLDLNVNLDLDGDGIPETPVTLEASSGSSKTTQVWRGDPMNGTLQTEISLFLTGTSPFGDFQIIAGDGNPNGINDGPLYSEGQITQRVDDPNTPEDESVFADSFFDVLFEIQGLPGGPIRNQSPIRMMGARGLAGLTEEGPVGLPHGPFESSDPDCKEFTFVTVEYCYISNTEVFQDQDGDGTFETRVGITLSEQHIPEPIPEPSATVSLALFGLAGIWRLKKKHSLK
ncbi:hypothetical protein [Okeania sp. SIO1I7]|uniref:hypothetical protein n=1 Tax=Okeania sp. SIO1I7 TaxID=2607772 RepID=UPI0013FAA1F0|nr:hypothetical protein [Okeania sp. SIO1I7]NET28083.1 hypothetical protein [Okeania sp. SIO1I7]